MININNIRNKVMDIAQKRAEGFGKVWLNKTKPLTQIGYTGRLRKGLKVEKKKEKRGIKMTSNVPKYAYVQKKYRLMHVPLTSIGRIGFHHIGASLNKTERMKRNTKKRLYWRGWRFGRQQGFSKYKYDFTRLGYKEAGGIRGLKKYLRKR